MCRDSEKQKASETLVQLADYSGSSITSGFDKVFGSKGGSGGADGNVVLSLQNY
jgi:hypothetical protein